MAATFVPFTPATRNNLAAASSGGKVDNSTFSSFAGAPSPAAIDASSPPESKRLARAPHCSGEPEITLERDQDRITQIRINCPCGQVIEIACGY